MEIPAVIDVAIGLVVLYLLLSTLSSFVVELIATWRWWRKRLLYETIGRLITDASFTPAPPVPYLPKMIVKGREKYHSWKGSAPSPVPSTDLFCAADITDAIALHQKLRQTDNPVSKFLAGKFDPAFTTKFLAPAPIPSASELAEQLNRAVAGESLFDSARFAGVTLSADTKALLAEIVLHRDNVLRSNRLLLEDTFPGVITHAEKRGDKLVIKDAPALRQKLRQPDNLISKFLAGKFDPAFTTGFLAPAPVPSESELAAQLDRAAAGESFFDAARFAGVTLSADTKALLAEIEGQSDNVLRLNRLLLEDAFPEAITRENRLTAETLAEFWEHPLAKNLSPDRQLPSYVEPATFATIVIDLAVPGAADGTLPATAEGLERVIELGARSGHAHLTQLRTQLLTIHRLRNVHSAAGSADSQALAALRAGIERWYGEAMERLGGQYKRKVQKALFWTGLVIAALLNADTIRTVHVLTTDDALRAATAAYGATLATPTSPQTNPPPAVVVAPTANTNSTAALPGNTNQITIGSTSTGPAPVPTKSEVRGAPTQSNEIPVAELRAELAASMRELQKLQRLGFPLGWHGSPFDADTRVVDFAPYGGAGGWSLVFKLIGLLATAFAVSLGAPFWFDLLGKAASLRSAGKRAGGSGEASSSADVAAGSKKERVDEVRDQASDSSAPTLPNPAEFLGDLADVGSGFSPRKAYWCAEAAQLAYSSEESVRAAVGQWAMGKPWFFKEVEAAQGFLSVDQDQRVAVLAFRGTEKKLEDWQTDARFKLVKSPAGSGNTHEGFTNELQEVYAGVVKELKAQTGEKTLLYITGHSLGGGLATLMATRLAADRLKADRLVAEKLVAERLAAADQPKAERLKAERLEADKARGVHAVHTFGSPRVGDPEFTKAYQLALGQCTYRIVNGEDLVTRVPPRVIPGTEWRYDHVGQIVYFDSDGRMQMNAGFWDRFVNTVINAVGDFRNTTKAALKDHSMEGYVRLLKRAAGKRA